MNEVIVTEGPDHLGMMKVMHATVTESEFQPTSFSRKISKTTFVSCIITDEPLLKKKVKTVEPAFLGLYF